MLNIGNMLDGKYEVVKVLGKGGMGTVYLCRNTRLGNLWAIKEFNNNTDNDMNFQGEPEVLKKLKHPGIPRIIDVFYENNNLYMVEDYVEGMTLKEQVLESGVMDTESICRVTSSICEIIAYLHGLNPPIIYSDLKPSNLMMAKDGNIVLIDFGISKVQQESSEDCTLCFASKGYAAPEQYVPGQCYKETDIYGIGMLMYFMSTGMVPPIVSQGLKDDEKLDHMNGELKNIMLKCVEGDITNRHASAEEVKDEIEALLNKSFNDDTELLSNTALNPEETLKNKKLKKPRNLKLMTAVLGAFIVLAVALAATSALKNSGKPDANGGITNKPPVSDTKASEAATKEQTSAEENKNTMPKETDIKNTEKNQSQPQGKGKGTDKKKYKTKHGNNENNDD